MTIYNTEKQEDIHKNLIIIIDFGSQYTQLIARRIREIGVYCEIKPYTASLSKLVAKNPKAFILSGGPSSINCDQAPDITSEIFNLGIPILGICYGMQLMANKLSGAVNQSENCEFGYAQLQLIQQCKLFDGIEDHIDDNGFFSLDVWMSHGDLVTEIPEGFNTVAITSSCPHAVIANEELKLYGIQFHPEVTHTKQGMRILERFICDIAKCEKLWNPDLITNDIINSIKHQVGDSKVILGLSGGVDSSVVAALLHKAIGDKLTCIFVDNGLLRLHEGDQVMAMFAKNMGINIIKVDASRIFLDKLANITDPEQKRKIIGNTFIEVFEEQATKLDGVEFLAQGTIYPDIIESASTSSSSHVIKSHHNVGGLPEYMKLKLVEPIKELFKDEVRKIGLNLGIPYEMVYRHPFPGPGLGVRIIGEVTEEKADILRQVDHIYIEELTKAGWYAKTSQAFAVFLPVKSVGVVGDARRHEYVVALRAVETVDFMTARWAHLPYELLEVISSRIINEVARISRVTYDISSKPPATIEWE
jgi:GMP synthase (glutamine-hydrolysing)